MILILFWLLATSTTSSPTSSISTSSPTITPTTLSPTNTAEPSVSYKPTVEPTYKSTNGYTFWDSTMISVVTIFSIMSFIGLVSFGYYIFHYFYTEPAVDIERRPLMERIKRRANPV